MLLFKESISCGQNKVKLKLNVLVLLPKGTILSTIILINLIDMRQFKFWRWFVELNSLVYRVTEFLVSMRS